MRLLMQAAAVQLHHSTRAGMDLAGLHAAL
jgi:hypothetical protein